MHLRCAVFLVSAVLYPRTIRQAYSCATGRAISLTAYTVNSLHQIAYTVNSLHQILAAVTLARAGNMQAGMPGFNFKLNPAHSKDERGDRDEGRMDHQGGKKG
jgi:hypothetical protein